MLLSSRHRRRGPGTILIALTATAALTACGSSGGQTSSPAQSSDTASPVSGGTLTFAINSDSNCLDPHQSPADVDGFFSRPILDSLVALDSSGKITPWLAKSWTISPDEKTYTFTLRGDVTFSNGEKFDAAAVKANLDHIVAPTTKSQLAAGTISTYTGTTVVNATTAAVHFSQPSSAFLATLATAYLGIEAPSTLEQSPDRLCSKIVGSGPFISTAGFVKQKGIDYVRNEAYKWGPGTASHTGPAYLAGVKVSVLSEDSSRLGALTSGQIDAVASVPPVDVKQLKSDAKFRIQTAQAPGGNYSYYPNSTKGVFADVRVREAFRAGIDWDTIVNKLYFGVFQAAKGPLSPATVGYDKSGETLYTYDLAKANELLDKAGWSQRDSAGYRVKDGKRLTIVHPFLKAYAREQRDTLADQIQASAKVLGFEMINKNTDVSSYLKDLGAGNYDIGDFSWQRASPDALRTLFGSENIATSGGFGTNQSRYTNTQVDSDLHAALATTDTTKQTELYAAAQQQIGADAVVFPVYVFNYVLGSTVKAHGLTFEPQAFPSFYDAWKSQ